MQTQRSVRGFINLLVIAMVLLVFLPRGDRAWTEWWMIRVSHAGVIVYFAVVLLMLRCQRARRYHNLMVAAGMSMSLIRIGVLLTGPGTDMEGLGFFLSVSSLAIALVTFDPDLRYTLAIVHLHIAALVVSALRLEMAQGFTSILVTYYGVALCLIEQTRRQQWQRHQRLWVQVENERLAERDRAAVKWEHDQALLQVEQEAMRSLTAAIFDICGTLHWQSADDVAEPQLCFGSEPIPQLDELLLRTASDQPLDIILGPPPAGSAAERDRWCSERERLWKYASMEAGASAGSTEQRGQAERVARKISVTGATGQGQTVEMDLFLTPCSDGRVLFGILSEAKERHGPAAPIVIPEAKTLQSTGSMRRTTSRRKGSSSKSSWSSDGSSAGSDLEGKMRHGLMKRAGPSSATSSRGSAASASPLSLQGAATLWVNASKPKMPILTRTEGFVGCSNMQEVLVDGDAFVALMQTCLAERADLFGGGPSPDALVEVATVQVAAWVDHRNREQVRATCTAYLSRDFEVRALMETVLRLDFHGCFRCQGAPRQRAGYGEPRLQPPRRLRARQIMKL